jgi:hypothetical protein
MLRLTTLPIPNAPGAMVTREISPDEAINYIRAAFRANECVSHIGYEQTNRLIELKLGGILERGDRHMPKPIVGDSFITIRLARGKGKSIDDFDFLLTEFSEGTS